MTDAEPFASLAQLRANHQLLLQQRRHSGEPADFATAIQQFILNGQLTGAYLAREDERWEAQNLLDYWSNEYQHLLQKDIDGQLAEYDVNLAPELDESLCPYIGLDPFSTADHDLYFGREPLVQLMVNRLQKERFLAISGPSGSGKTSLVLAGLLPELQAGHLNGSQSWTYCPRLVPGTDPIQNLIHLLCSPEKTATGEAEVRQEFLTAPETLTRLLNSRCDSQTVVLVVDQFEEAFTVCQDQESRSAFIHNLFYLATSPKSSHYLIITMRTDLESNLVRFPDFQTAYNEAQLRITTMNATELRQASRQPADLVGLIFEDGLVDQLVSDVLGEPAALPLLQFSLWKLWENREHNRVTWKAYKDLGSGRDALATSADKLYNQLNPAEQKTARRIFLKMVRPTQGLDVVRHRVRREQLYERSRPQARVDNVLTHFIQDRLIRIYQGEKAALDELEITHETLVKNWPRLIGWLDEERVALRHRLRLTEMADQWESLDRDESALLRGIVLAEAKRYRDLNDLESDFVAASVAEAERIEREELEAQQRELEQTRRFARRISMLAAALSIVLLLALAFALLARRNALIAEDNAKQSQENAAAALDNKQAAEAAQGTAEGNLVIAEQNAATAEAAKIDALNNAVLAATAVSLAVEQQTFAEEARLTAELNEGAAQYAQATAEANEALAERNEMLATGRELASNALTHLASDPQLSLLLALEAIHISTESNNAPPAEATDVLYRALQAAQQTATLAGHTAAVNDTAVSPDGRWIVTVSDDEALKLWDADSGQEQFTFTDHNAPITSVAFSPNGNFLVSGDEDSLIIVWNMAAGRLVGAMRGQDDGAVNAVAFHPDGERIAVGYDAGTSRIWNFETSSPLIRQNEHDGPINDIQFTPDGRLFATAGADGTILVQSSETGVPVYSFAPEQNDLEEIIPVNGIAFSPDGTYMAAAKGDGDALLWEGEAFLVAFSGHSGPLLDVAFNSDSSLLATASADTSAKIWDIGSRRVVQTLSGHTNNLTAVDFFPNSSRLVTASTDNSARTWTTETFLEPIALTEHRAGVNSARYNEAGTAVVTGSTDQTARVWDSITGQILATFLHNQTVTAAAFQPSGMTMATASTDSNVRLWDLNTHEVMLPFLFHPVAVNTLDFHPDGSQLVTGAEDHIVRLWDLSSSDISLTLELANPVSSVSYSKDGSQIAVTGGDTALIWDPSSGETGSPLSGHNGFIHHAAFSPDGKQLATAGADGIVILWNLETGDFDRTFSGHSGPVLWVTFSQDGTLLATASVDETVRLWDVATGQALRTILGHTSAVTAVAFSPDTRNLLTSSLDSTARITPLPDINELLGLAWERLDRPLSAAECTQYLHGLPCLTTAIGGPAPKLNP